MVPSIYLPPATVVSEDLPIGSSDFDEELLLAEPLRDEAEESGDTLDDDIKKFMPKTSASTMAAAGVATLGYIATGASGLLPHPIDFGVGGLVAGGLVLLNATIAKRHHRQVARKAAIATRERDIAERRAAVISDVTSRSSRLLEEAQNAKGRDKENYRGQLLGEVLQGAAKFMPKGSAVAFYRAPGRSIDSASVGNEDIVPGPVHYGWSTIPPAIRANSPVAKELQTSALSGTPVQGVNQSGRNYLILPVTNGGMFYGAVHIEAPPGVTIDPRDTNQLEAWVKMAGLSYAHR